MLYIGYFLIVNGQDIQNNRCQKILLPSAVHLEERLTVSQSAS